MRNSLSPTTVTYGALQNAYDHFNRELFDGRLPPCLITLQRRDRRTHGYHWAQRFQEIDGDGRTDEIALNPAHFRAQPLRETLGTLVHEMVHLWQQHYGSPPRSGYHDRQWAAEMRRVGLHPSHTGQPGGREVGQQMDHWVVEDGLFGASCARLLTDGFRLAWGEIDAALADRPAKPPTRAKFLCRTCGAAAWGRPSLRVTCSDCDEPMVAEQAAEADAA